MKGRSHHEDWVDGSWTVDCVCGVNFDDGEEMVNCDDCGVWVHTRCSRYVKGQELFTCDKCKRKNNNVDDDIEETEVAQLLIELPTKTLRMENSCTRNVPLKRPFRLWTETPTEEKVHVQGIPGGDPALFGGLSSVFSRELWKCTGYVPKKFNFKYREFPCWDEEEKDEVENGFHEENGAGVLFSMSKESLIAAPASALAAMKSLDDSGTNGCAKDSNSWRDSGEAEMKHSRSVIEKDKRLLRPLITSKRRKELFGASKERMKKKVEVADKDEDGNKGSQPTSGSTPSESCKDTQLEGFTRDGGITKIDKYKKEESIDGGLALKTGGDESGNTEIGVECSREQNLSDVHTNGAGKQEEKAGHHFRIVLKNSATNDPSASGGKYVSHNEADKAEERQGTIADAPGDDAADSPESFRKPLSGFTRETEEKICDDVSGKISSRKSKFQKEIVETGAGRSGGQQTLDSIDSKVPEHNKMTPSSSLPPDDQKLKPVDMVSEGTTSGKKDRATELKREVLVSEAEKDSLETKPGSSVLQETSKPCRPVPHTFSVYSRPKMVVCIGKSSSSSATEESSRCDDNPMPSTSRNSIPASKQQSSDGDANANTNDEDCVSSDVIRERDGDDEPPKKTLEKHPKFSITSTKSMQHSRTSHSSVSKARESSSSLKASSAARLSGGSSEASGKHTLSGTFQKNEKPGQSTKNPIQSITSLTPNLSDEELALRLHHQLNSSPRVPRVPRMSQPGSLPLSPTATSLKRTYSSGSKDHTTFSRRKNKDAKEGLNKFRDDDSCSTKSIKTRRPPNWRTQQDSGRSRGNICTKGEENGNRKTSYSSRRVLLHPNSTTSTSSGPSSSEELNEHNKPSPHSSPRNNGNPVRRTLPGLINEIMSKGKRMTYEELCNAVLPHWPHLRKHNGERYAYSSHSQAVLDCLRNRHEWARLVDRGPKTNSGKKKRKLDAAEEEESDENESSKGGRKQLHHSQGEEFPKGKRKARKRRRLSLQGKGIKVIRKKRNEEVSEEEEEGALSDTSEESVFCEEGEVPTTATAREVSASSSEDSQSTS